MPSPPQEKLSRREREIMDALFALGNRASAEEIRTRLTNPPSSSAVRAMLTRLEAKGYLRHREEGALSKLVQVFFGGSPRDTATALLKQESWTEDELDALRSEIDRVRKEKRQS